MIGRRAVLKGATLMGIPQRADQKRRNVTRGGVVPGGRGGTLVARRVIVTGPAGGVYVYNGAVAAGTLLASTGPGGLDPSGLNNTLPGVASYLAAGSGYVASAMYNGSFFTSSNIPNGYAGAYTNTGEITQASGYLEINGGTNGLIFSGTNVQVNDLTQMVLGAGPSLPKTAAMLEVDGMAAFADGLQVGNGAGHVVVAANATINTAGITYQVVTSAGNVAGVILQAGTVDGQIFVLVSQNGVSTITFAAAGSNIAQNSFVVSPDTAYIFVYNHSAGLWFPVG